jgi:glycosyltransferase involved in cell wall biosynthesis
MRLLIITQSVDSSDPQFSFFHRWLQEFAKRFELVHVICLKEGMYMLPANVIVHSLGKEEGESRGKYIRRLYWYALKLAGKYDAVFVHQNQEYVLLAGWLWRLMGKRVYLWRNHWAGSALTDIAVKFCAKIFCTSAFSYTAKFPNNKVMPVGIDTELFSPVKGSHRHETILSLGRIAPSKHLEVIIEALPILRDGGLEIKAHIYGNALYEHQEYEKSLHQRASDLHVDHLVVFHPGVSNAQIPSIYSGHEIFINCSESGMYDKTIFEALACGALTFASSQDYAKAGDARLVFDGTARDLALKVKQYLKFPDMEKEKMRAEGQKLAASQSLATLIERLAEAMN